jgi:putative FmdB family regulatory protein
MPTYEYRCPKGHRFDVFQKMSDPPVAKCPTCGKPGERMIVPGAGFLFKGEGFYITDSRSEDYKKAKAAGEQPPAVASPGKSESTAKSESGGKESKSEKSETSEKPGRSEKSAAKEPKAEPKRSRRGSSGGDE